MDLPPFLLDHWMGQYDPPDRPIAYNLASSTGPRWSIEALTRLGGDPLDITSGVLSYAPPVGGKAVREQVAAFHGVDPDWVVMTTGASEALSSFFCLAECAGGNLVVPDPGYPAYAAMARAWRLGVNTYALTAGTGFVQHAGLVLDAVDRDTVAVIVNTPHNPTGSVMLPDEVARLAAALAARGVPLIVDEVYHPLYFGDAIPSAAGIENVVVMSDLSKAMSLPGLRTGWLIDRNAARRARLIDARSYFTISSSPLLELLAAHALRHHDAILGKLRAVASDNLLLLDTLLAGAQNILSWTRPAGGTTCFPWFTDMRDSRPFCTALADAGVLVAPGDCFGHASHMRIGFAQQAHGFADAVRIIAERIGG